MITDKEKTLLRELAFKVRTFADSDLMEEKRGNIRKHNSLEKNTKPLIFSFPEGAWDEIFTVMPLECSNELARAWEMNLRMKIFTYDYLKDDQAFDPFFDISWYYVHSGFGVDIEYTSGANRGSFSWKSGLKNLDEDLNLLKPVNFYVDKKATFDEVEQATNVFGDILPIRMRGQPCWSLGLSCEAIKLIGLEDFMFNMYDNPEGLHKLMGYLQEQYMSNLDYLEKENLLTLNNQGDNVGSGGQGYTDELPQNKADGAHITTADLWMLSESQETVGVSPEMFNEFVLKYQLPIINRFGLACYGCCEPLHNRWDYIKNIPNLRRVSVSPWCDQEFMGDVLKGKAIFSRKPHPSLVCTTFEEQKIAEDIKDTLKFAEGCNLEIILKDTHTIHSEPERLRKWVEITRNEIEKH